MSCGCNDMSVETIKAAKIEDHWNHVNSRKNFNVRICKLHMKGIPLFDASTVEINSALTSVCGRNGVGKSSLLKLLYRILSNEKCDIGVFNTYDIKSVEIEVLYNGKKIAFTDQVKNELPYVEYFDASSLALKIIDEISSDKEKNGWFNTSSTYGFTPKDLFFTQKITGKKYEYVKVNEVEGIIDDVIFPYFEVKEVNSTTIYTSENMGQGEHKLLIAIWKLIYVENNTVMFIEEPESFICPISQKNFMDYLAYIIDTKKLNVFMATHSEHVLKPQNLDSVLVLAKKGKRYTISNCGDNYRYFNALGLAPEKKNIFLLEDEFAKLVLECILKAKSMHLYSTSYLHSLGGESHIKKVSEHYKDSSGLNIVAVFDADQLTDNSWLPSYISKVFLPSANKFPPELEIVSFINDHIKDYAERLNVDYEILEGEIENITCDHHDFFIELANVFNEKSLAALKVDAITLWIEKNSNKIDEFLYSLTHINDSVLMNLLDKQATEQYRYAEINNGTYRFKVDGDFNSYRSGKHMGRFKHSPELGEIILTLVG